MFLRYLRPEPQRDDDEFEREALSHLGSLLAVATRLTRNAADGEDLVQDALVKALRAKHRFQAGTNMRAWLLRILTNTFINRYRRDGLEKSLTDGPDADPLTDGWVSVATMEAMRDPESQALRPVIAREIETALDALPDEFRLAVLLADVEELSYKEIADVMGCPIGTVMSRLHRGRRLLKDQLVDHARALGLVPAENDSAEAAEAPVELKAYRERRGMAR
jgi:RNA polymerase sigma-70 factor (ECF subfamily)